MSIRVPSDYHEPHSGDDLPLLLRALIIAGVVLVFGLLLWGSAAFEGVR